MICWIFADGSIFSDCDLDGIVFRVYTCAVLRWSAAVLHILEATYENPATSSLLPESYDSYSSKIKPAST